MHDSYQPENRIGGTDNTDDALHGISRPHVTFVHQVIASRVRSTNVTQQNNKQIRISFLLLSRRRADRRIHFNGAKLCVRNGGHSAGFDEKNQFKIFI